jgi:hypothetical protein
MRQFETLLHELDIAGWTAVQGNKALFQLQLLRLTNGFRLRANWAFCCIYAKTLDQKKMAPLLWRYLNLVSVRMGFEDIVFNNATIQIDMGEKDRGHTRVRV